MDTTVTLAHITFGISICFISWFFALFMGLVLKPLGAYQALSNINLVRSAFWNKILLVNTVQWVIKNTFFKYFNPAIKLANGDTDLEKLRHEMTVAEVNHLVAFIFVLVVATYIGIQKGLAPAIAICHPAKQQKPKYPAPHNTNLNNRDTPQARLRPAQHQDWHWHRHPIRRRGRSCSVEWRRLVSLAQSSEGRRSRSACWSD